VSNTPWRGTKLTAYEGGIRAPLIVSWPAGIHRDGQIASDVGHLFDLTATFLDAARAEYPAEWQGRTLLPLDGRSLLPALTGKTKEGASPGGHRELYWRAPQNRAARIDNWKLVESLDLQGTWELYDLANDPGETRNLAAAKPELVREFVAKWDQWNARCQGQ
jgi:arylsulfatase